MDMALLSEMIGGLLTEHDAVTLPGLGSVKSEIVGSSFSDRGYTINPPYRRITFYSGEGGDNLLCDLYAKDNGLSPEESKAMLKGFLRQIKSMLREKKTVLFPGLGVLRASKEDNYIFIQDDECAVSPDFFGLNPLSLKNHQFSCESVPEMKEIPMENPSESVIAAGARQKNCRIKRIFASRAFRRTTLWTLFIVLFLMALLRIIGTAAPELIDRFLYTSEELRIIYY